MYAVLLKYNESQYNEIFGVRAHAPASKIRRDNDDESNGTKNQ